mmetsp:Transcript_13837/g.36289  ORF Transcript_13837/g.36289 Transcript_13837/m.36289 type:complete len:205 (-) Transcript_13837:202-816(-)
MSADDSLLDLEEVVPLHRASTEQLTPDGDTRQSREREQSSCSSSLSTSSLSTSIATTTLEESAAAKPDDDDDAVAGPMSPRSKERQRVTLEERLNNAISSAMAREHEPGIDLARLIGLTLLGRSPEEDDALHILRPIAAELHRENVALARTHAELLSSTQAQRREQRKAEAACSPELASAQGAASRSGAAASPDTERRLSGAGQ